MAFLKIERGGGMVAKIDVRKVQRALTRFPMEFAQESRKAFKRGGISWEREMKTKQFVGYTGQSPVGQLQVRTGNLRRSIQYRLQGNSLSTLWLVLQAGDNRADYARTQERGAIIKARAGKYLKVPLPEALTASGVIKGSALIRKQGKRYVTDYGDTEIFTARNGKKFITVRTQQGRKKGVRGKLLFLYILKEQVVIPGPDSTGAPSSLGAERRARMMISDVLTQEINAAAARTWARGGSR